jgi:hypothetical protein
METIGKTFLGLLILSTLIVGSYLLYLVLIPVHKIDNSIQTTHGVIDKVVNSDSALTNYEWFKQQEADIQRTETQYEEAKKAAQNLKNELPKDRLKWDDSDKAEYDRLQATATGLDIGLESMKKDYDARSAMASRNLYKNHLPMTINKTVKTYTSANGE